MWLNILFTLSLVCVVCLILVIMDDIKELKIALDNMQEMRKYDMKEFQHLRDRIDRIMDYLCVEEVYVPTTIAGPDVLVVRKLKKRVNKTHTSR